MPKFNLVKSSKTHHAQQGMAVVMVLMLSALLMILITTGLSLVINTAKDTSQVFVVEGQVGNVAQAGLQDAVAWFKRHQPVKQDVCKDGAFAPQHLSDPSLSDTDDASIGIVRDIQIKDSVYGRYVVKRQACPGADDPHAAHDITLSKGKSTICPGVYCTNMDGTVKGEGAVWYLESQATVYIRNNYSKDADGVFTTGPQDPPNRILRQGGGSIEISQLTVQPPGDAPLILTGTGSDNFNSNCSIRAGSSGTTATSAIMYNGTNPNVTNLSVLPTGLTKKASSSQAITTNSVFSVSTSELRGMSDNVYTSLSQVPSSIKFSITFLEGNFTFTNAAPLNGGGLLYVNGNLTLNDASNSTFSGVIFVNGHLTIGRDNQLSGIVFAKDVNCNPGSPRAVVEYNPNLVTTVRQKLALYRENNLTRSYREY